MKGFNRRITCIFLIMTFMSSLIINVNVRAADDEYDILREKWVETLTGGTEYDVNDPLIAAQITINTNNANQQWSKLNKAINLCSQAGALLIQN